jgi:hypothetical protein
MIENLINLVLCIIACFSIGRANSECIGGVTFLLILIMRIIWYVTLPIVYTRLTEVWGQVDQNINIIQGQKQKFIPIATECGDPLNIMHTELASS